jgi:hypothetical protein
VRETVSLIELGAHGARRAHERDAVARERVDTATPQWRISRNTLEPIARPPSFAGA